jgi:DNA-binding response OmpR family regulator
VAIMLNAKILVVDDDPAFCQLLERVLRKEGAQVIAAGCCQEAVRVLDAERPDLILLDMMMPTGDGFETCEQLRKRSGVPIIMLSAFNQVEFVVKGLRCGADDYIAKPVQLTVLLARIHAVLRRAARALPPPHPLAEYLDDHLAVDLQLRRVWVDGEIVQLSPTELSLLIALVEHAGHPMTCQQILDQVWGGWACQPIGLRPCLHLSAAPQDRARPARASLPPDRVRGGISLRATTALCSGARLISPRRPFS